MDDLEESLRDVPLELTPEGARVHGAHAAYLGDEAAGTANKTKVTDAEVRDQIGDLAGMLRPYQMEGVCWMTSRILRGGAASWPMKWVWVKPSRASRWPCS